MSFNLHPTRAEVSGVSWNSGEQVTFSVHVQNSGRRAYFSDDRTAFPAACPMAAHAPPRLTVLS